MPMKVCSQTVLAGSWETISVGGVFPRARYFALRLGSSAADLVLDGAGVARFSDPEPWSTNNSNLRRTINKDSRSLGNAFGKDRSIKLRGIYQTSLAQL